MDDKASASPDNPPSPDKQDEQETRGLRQAVVRALHTVYDPEIPVDIYELGLIYAIDIPEPNVVQIRMTLTAPSCPMAEALLAEVETKTRAIPGVRDVQLELVWEPPWEMRMMSEAARLTLGL